MNRIGFIGGGKMASAIIKGIINSGYSSKEDIYVSDKNPEALDILKKNFGINIYNNNIYIAQNCDVIFRGDKTLYQKKLSYIVNCCRYFNKDN